MSQPSALGQHWQAEDLVQARQFINDHNQSAYSRTAMFGIEGLQDAWPNLPAPAKAQLQDSLAVLWLFGQPAEAQLALQFWANTDPPPALVPWLVERYLREPTLELRRFLGLHPRLPLTPQHVKQLTERYLQDPPAHAELLQGLLQRDPHGPLLAILQEKVRHCQTLAELLPLGSAAQRAGQWSAFLRALSGQSPDLLAELADYFDQKPAELEAEIALAVAAA